MARTIRSHRNCTQIMDLVIEHDALDPKDLDGRKLWIEKVTALKIKWNIEFQPSGFGKINQNHDYNNDKVLCPLGCGTYVGKTYVARHRSKCAAVNHHLKKNSITRQQEQQSTYENPRSKQLKEYIKDAMSQMRKDIVYDLITTDPSFLRYWNHHFSEHMQNHIVQSSQKKNHIQEIRGIGKFYHEYMPKDGYHHSFLDVLLKLQADDLVKFGLHYKDSKRLITTMKKMLDLEKKHLTQQLCKDHPEKAKRYFAEALQYLNAFWDPKHIGDYYCRHVGNGKIKDKKYEALLVQKNVPIDDEVTQHLDAIHSKLNPVLENNIKILKHGKSVKMEDYSFIQKLLLTYIVINSRRRGNEVASITTEVYKAQKRMADENSKKYDDICKELFSVRCIGKFGTENPIAVSEFVMKGINFLLAVKEPYCDTSKYLFAKVGKFITNEERKPIRSPDAKKFTEITIGQRLNQTREYRSNLAFKTAEMKEGMDRHTMLRCLAHGNRAHEVHYHAKPDANLRKAMSTYSHKPKTDKNKVFETLCQCEHPDEDSDLLAIATECGCHGNEEGFGRSQADKEREGNFSCLIVDKIFSIQY